MFKLPWITKEIMLTSLTLISCHSIIQSEETSIAQKASKYKLLKFGKIKYKPGYSAFKVYQLNDNPKTGYIALNGVKVADYNAAGSTPYNQVAIARLAKSAYVLNVDEGELVTGVKKSVDSWIKDIKAQGKRLIGKMTNEDTLSQVTSRKKGLTKTSVPAKQSESKVESQPSK